jgi:hypothetical protein
LGKLQNAETIVLTSPDGALARLAAAELAGSINVPVMVLAGGTEAWAGAGLPLETGATRMASAPEDVVLSARERGQGREEGCASTWPGRSTWSSRWPPTTTSDSGWLHSDGRGGLMRSQAEKGRLFREMRTLGPEL